VTAPLNLATQPPRNERLPALLLSLAAIALVGLTVRHAFVVWALLPSRTSALHREVEAQDAEVARLRTEVAALRAPKPDPAAVKQWALVKGLVDRRAFSWTDLFDRLEEVLPPGVRLLSVAPTVRDGELRLELQALARSGEDALQFLGVLQKRPEFGDANVLGLDDSDEGTQVTYTMKFVPSARPAPSREARP